MFGADPTAAFTGVQAVVMAIVALAPLGTVGAYSLGVPARMTWAVFVAFFVALMAAGWGRLEDAHPRHGEADRE